MDRIAVFPGSFDPFTLGHEALVLRALNLFDKVIIGIGLNTKKKGLIPHELRMQWIKDCFKDQEKVEVIGYTGLTVNFCREQNAPYILRGLRDGKDFDYERSIAMMNRDLAEEIETYFLITDPEYTAINASIVREIAVSGGDIDRFVPRNISDEIKNFLKNEK